MGGVVNSPGVPQNQNPPTTQPRRKLKWVVLVIAGILISTWVWLRISYPHGISHCCPDVLVASLGSHATNHGGWFPHGEQSPEASLAIVCRTDTNLLDVVRGKNIPLKLAQQVWSSTGALGPETCGWNYVEGLRSDDGKEVAMAWDKVFGLGHNGQRIRGLAHEVIMADGSLKGVAMKEWPKFAMEQREKLAALIALRGTNAPPIRWSDEDSLGTNWFPVPKQ